jgi:hypothetical protein
VPRARQGRVPRRRLEVEPVLELVRVKPLAAEPVREKGDKREKE